MNRLHVSIVSNIIEGPEIYPSLDWKIRFKSLGLWLEAKIEIGN